MHILNTDVKTIQRRTRLIFFNDGQGFTILFTAKKKRYIYAMVVDFWQRMKTNHLTLEEEEILDHEIEHVKTAPYWPYLLLGGVAGGILKVVFRLMAPQTGFTVQVILLILLSMIVMNTTLNFYYQKKKSARDIRTAVIICLGIYVVMQLLSRLVLVAMDKYPYEFFDTWMVDIPVSLAGGAVVSVLVAILSRKAE